tara:strand:+ start:111 stop:284 length:174 start_codon:yes stop_codon:yes gene_type:complete
MIKTNSFSKCVEFLLYNKKIKESEVNDIPKVYRAIELSNNELFCELKKELIENGWVA